MPGFERSGRAGALVEDVWKLLFDPARFPEWWYGIETVRTDGAVEEGGTRRYAQWLHGAPDFPMPQVLRSDRDRGRVTVSCQVRDVDVAWHLAGDGDDTVIKVRVDVADAEIPRLPMLETMMERSLGSLATLAESEATPQRS